MTETFALLAIGFAIGLGFAAVSELLIDRRNRRRRPSDLAELQRHQALPPAPPRPEPVTGDTIRLHTIDVARPLPDHPRLVMMRRKRPE